MSTSYRTLRKKATEAIEEIHSDRVSMNLPLPMAETLGGAVEMVEAFMGEAGHAINRPYSTHIAQKVPMLLRVGAWNTTGYKSTGGTRVTQREPCCRKWHLSSNDKSISPF